MLRRHCPSFVGLASIVVAAAAPHPAWSATGPRSAERQDLTALSLEELAKLRVTVVTRVPQSQAETPAAIDVVTGDEIRRAGATSFAEALRLAPGTQVARANSDRWAVGIRGFASTLSRSVLVMIDGRSVYTPLFAGTYWETQDTMLADVDRIEVVRGPGGTLWGANAVNGVVNLITKSARESQGLYVEGGGGTEELVFGGARYGGRLGDSAAYRAYAKYFRRGPAYHPDARDFDAWHMGQGGFRLDWDTSARDSVTFQGDLYAGRLGQRRVVAQFSPPFSRTVEQDADVSGGNFLGRWRRSLGGGSVLAAQAYYDRTYRAEAYLTEARDTFDVDLQHNFSPLRGHELVWGLGFRATADQTTGLPAPFFDPADRTDQLWSAFLQDEVAFAGDSLRLSLGAKAEHNDYSGFEVQPSARLLWAAGPKQSVWLAASRAVRTPSRADTDQVQTVYLGPSPQPLFVRAVGDKEFRSETALVLEAGYRVRPIERLGLDLAGFYDGYDNLLGGRIGTPFVESAPPPPRLVIPVLFGNLLEGETYGAELAVEARPHARVQLSGTYAFLRVVVRPRSPTPGLTPDPSAGSSPRHQAQLRSALELPGRTSLDLMFRYVSALPAQKVPAYASLDVRLAWRPAPRLEVAVVGQNLLDPHHPEFGGGVEIERGVYGMASLRF
jgi:iron complex outermembrane recepter protein